MGCWISHQGKPFKDEGGNLRHAHDSELEESNILKIKETEG